MTDTAESPPREGGEKLSQKEVSAMGEAAIDTTSRRQSLAISKKESERSKGVKIEKGAKGQTDKFSFSYDTVVHSNVYEDIRGIPTGKYMKPTNKYDMHDQIA